MKTINKIIANRNAAAWLLLVTAVALHVFDETVTDFLPFYNQFVIDLRERLGFFPAPTFSFGVWLGGLIAAIVLGYSLTPVVMRGGKTIRAIALILGVLMVVNGLLHLFTSVYFGRISPGMWSSPFLIYTRVRIDRLVRMRQFRSVLKTSSEAKMNFFKIQRMEHNHDNIKFR